MLTTSTTCLSFSHTSDCPPSFSSQFLDSESKALFSNPKLVSLSPLFSSKTSICVCSNELELESSTTITDSKDSTLATVGLLTIGALHIGQLVCDLSQVSIQSK
ncbi:hypothetical protein MtrunA17_Chr2g0279441 [Medicago truncatula]|uniref:Uncharacterized protein n=1 Tax=Medicago truncatula TaxID=3880 RepID=A0A396J0Y8_MEDTR|nr:hypothetical protein MtrunA17_Chr2g0279441 [Medicago truncatula]